MQENYQLIFNAVFVGAMIAILLAFSYGAKSKKASGDKDRELALMETLGDGIIFIFLFLLVFVVGVSVE